MVARYLLCAVILAQQPGLAGQNPGAQTSTEQALEGWNGRRVQELLRRARDVRQSVAVDSAFRSYRAEARGYVYFFVDRPDSDDHVLVKVDQVALDLYWRAPHDTRQHIAGLRDEKVLPTNIRYHLDHLTVVQDDFGDYIRLGGGDEVEQVLHPVGPGSQEIYDFQIVDSLSLTYSDGQAEVRVYEVQVRPKSFDRPGFIGTVFLDRATAAIVRMNFSFTPASYVDSYLDYIRISLDNSLWMERYWLPYRQEVELRREMPFLDFSSGSVIRSRFRIRGYDFNVELPGTLFAGRGISSLPVAEREAFAFERGIFDDIEGEGLTISTTMEEVRAQVREVVRDEVLSGLAPARLHLDGISDFARYNRAEGAFVGAGLTLRPRGDLRVRTSAGYAFGRRRVSGRISATDGGASLRTELAVYWDAVGDIGGNPGASPLLNTISAASGDRDFLDPYFRRGASVTIASAQPGGTSVRVRWEDHRSARDVVSDGADTNFRPVRSVDEGVLGAVELSALLGLPGNGSVRVTTLGGRLGARNFVSATGQARWTLGTMKDSWSGRVSLRGGATNPGAPVQMMYLIGGRHTLPGHEYRTFLGNAYWLLRGGGTVPVRPPYLGIRAFGMLGATYLGAVRLPMDWTQTDSDGLRGSVGLGLSLAWDTMYFDVAHGVRGGGWEAIFSVSEQFQGWM